MFNPDQLGQLVRLLLKAEDNGVSFDAIKSALQNIQAQTVEVEPKEQPAPAITEYTGKVDYSLSIEDAVKAGKYNWSNDNITADNFPVLAGEQGLKDLKFALAHFNRTMSSDNVIADMDKLGYRPATAREILSFGAKHPDLQRQFPIVALGHWVGIDGYRRLLCLDGGGSSRELDLGWFDNGWDDSCRFLFVCK